jgi:hypothetical protein
MLLCSSAGNDQYRICVIQGNREGVQLAESLIHDIILNQPLIENYEMFVPQVRKVQLCTYIWRPVVCESSRRPHVLDNWLRDGGTVDSFMHRPHFTPQKDSWYSFLLKADSTPGAAVWLE